MKKKKKERYFFKSLHYLKYHKGLLCGVIFSCLIATSISVLQPFFLADVLTALTDGNVSFLMISAVKLLAVELAVSVVHMSLYGTCADKLRSMVAQDIRKDLIEATLNLKQKNFEKNASGRILQIITNDTMELSNSYNKIIDLTVTTLSKLAVVVFMFQKSWILTLYCIFEIAVLLVVNKIRMKYRYKDRMAIKDNNDESTLLVSEMIRGMKDIRNFNVQDVFAGKLNKTNEKLQKSDCLYGKRQYFLYRVNEIAKSLLFFAFFPFCILLIKNGLLTFSVAFTVFVFKNNLLAVFPWIVETYENNKDGELHATRIYSVLEGYCDGFEKFEVVEPILKKERRNLEIKNLTFAYDENDVIDGLNLTVGQGERIALVGYSGCGKTTLVKLLNRTYDIDDETIFLGGIDINKISKNELRNEITVVSQDSYLFNLSIEENLTLVKPNASKRELIKVCKQAQIYDFIKSLPDGFDTILGEGGVKISGGQRQRLAIARALLKNGNIFVFDEATSSLDNENQHKIQETIDKLDKSKTVIVIAHRLSTIANVDKIYFMKDGQIFAEGTHEQLMKNCKEYVELYKREKQ